MPGTEKSSISLLKITPVTGSNTLEPKTVLTVEVIETAIPFRSTMEVWLWEGPSVIYSQPWCNGSYGPMVRRDIMFRVIVFGRVSGILVDLSGVEVRRINS